MPVKNYCLLAGEPTDRAHDDDNSPHLEILLEADGVEHRIAVNVRSIKDPHPLYYAKRQDFEHPMTDKLESLPDGLTDLRDEAPELALDYVRDEFITRDEMNVVPYRREGPDNDLYEHLRDLVDLGIEEDGVRFFAFGTKWGPEQENDPYFGFSPGRGIHNIHMNQGSRGRFAEDNGVEQDGALIAHIPGNPDRWVAIFLGFQSQCWSTDDQGHPIESECREPQRDPGPRKHDPKVRIVAALVNPEGREATRETVTLFNRGDTDVDLSGWHLEDEEGRKASLEGKTIGAGEALRVSLADSSMRLSNDYEEIKLVGEESVVDRREYSSDAAETEGWSVLF